jgi:hypothetical protein
LHILELKLVGLANRAAEFLICRPLKVVMADDDGKSLRPVRKSKQIAEDMRLAMMMACQLSKQIDKAERVSVAMHCHRLASV